jgi:hypothetical protein
MRTGCRSAISVVLAGLLSPGLAGAFGLRFTAVDLDDTLGPGGDLWQYAYFASGFSFAADQGFSVEFDGALYGALGDPPFAVNADWDVLVIQPDPQLPTLPGVYDALALVEGASLADPFVVRFVWLGGPGLPGAQPWDLNQYDAQGNLLAVLASGTTVPAPGADAAGVCAFAALWAHRTRRRSRASAPALIGRLRRRLERAAHRQPTRNRPARA